MIVALIKEFVDIKSTATLIDLLYIDKTKKLANKLVKRISIIYQYFISLKKICPTHKFIYHMNDLNEKKRRKLYLVNYSYSMFMYP